MLDKFRKQLETNARVSKSERSLMLLPIGHTESSVEFVTVAPPLPINQSISLKGVCYDFLASKPSLNRIRNSK